MSKLLKRIGFQNFGKKILVAGRRFPATFISIVVLFVFSLITINSSDEISFQLWVFFLLNTIGTLSISLWSESRRLKTASHLLLLMLFVGLLLWFSLTLPDDPPRAVGTTLVVVGITSVLSWFIAPTTKRNDDNRFWFYAQEMIFQIAITLIFTSIIFGGIILAFEALKGLFGVTIKSSVYEHLSIFLYVLFAPFYFLSNVPDLRVKTYPTAHQLPKVYRIGALYILLPILMLYGVILYGYFAKIVINWGLPNGWLSWMVSILTVLGFLLTMIVFPLSREKEERVARTFIRLFPYFILPLLGLMLVGIIRRFSDYGITVNRLLILIFNLWMIGVNIYLLLSKSKHPRWILMTMVAVGLFFSFGPWSYANVSKLNTTAKYKRYLEEYSVQKKSDEGLDDKKMTELKSLHRYLREYYGKDVRDTILNVQFSTNERMSEFLKTMSEFTSSSGDSYYAYFSYDYRKALPIIDLENYKQMSYFPYWEEESFPVNENEEIVIENFQLNIYKNEQLSISIPMDSVIRSLFENQNQEGGGDVQISDSLITLQGENYKLVLLQFSGAKNARSKSKNGLEIYNFSSILLWDKK